MAAGTPLSANSVAGHAFLRDEWALLGRVAREGTPYVGICFGAQLMARVLGARVSKSPVREIGGLEVDLTPWGARSPFLRGFPRRVPAFTWHGETFGVPRGAHLLAEGGGCRNQAYSRGRVLGLQFHLETGPDEAAAWADAYARELDSVGRAGVDVVRECRERAPAMRPLARRLIDNVLGMVGNPDDR